jgi:uncharacterized protein (DUF305 family)
MNCRLVGGLASALLLVALCSPAAAADPTEAGRNLPDICKSAAADDTATSGMGSMATHGMDKAHQDLMQGMPDMNAHMNQGMMAKNIDIAFVCGMIPHHQGAIDMAKAELAHGTNPWAKAMARKIIDAQAKEIADMLDWLKKQSK